MLPRSDRERWLVQHLCGDRRKTYGLISFVRKMADYQKKNGTYVTQAPARLVQEECGAVRRLKWQLMAVERFQAFVSKYN